jgi:hypothetical protein
MNRPRLLTTVTLLALVSAAHAADAASGAASAAHGGPTLAAAADRQLRQADVPSTSTDPARKLAPRADAGHAADERRLRLQVQRQNLKGPEAARAIAEQTNPNTIDRATAYGDKDHTQQVANLKLTLKKRGPRDRDAHGD